MGSFTWLHISDLHFRISQAWDADIVLRELLRDIKDFVQKNKIKFDFIIVSGDIAYSGIPDEYELSKDFLNELLKLTGLTKDDIFIVPGNHDVCRSLIPPARSIIRDGLRDSAKVNEVMNDALSRKVLLSPLDNYKKFINTFFEKDMFNDENYFYTKLIKKEDKSISLLLMNSALIAGSMEDCKNLIMGEIQVRNALEEANGADIRVAIMHHPLDCLKDFDRKSIKSQLERCNLILHGHLHETGINFIQNPDAKYGIIGAGACFETRKSHNSYNIVNIDFDSGKGKIWLRLFSENRGGFWTDDTITYKNSEKGLITFDLSIILITPKNKDKESDRSQRDQYYKYSDIPLPPDPYYPHRYPIEANFTGRNVEQRDLSEWLMNDKKPILMLVSIGGMGKTSLTWYWMQNYADFSNLDGVMWWSFYWGNISFSEFLNKAIIYISKDEIDPHKISSDYDKVNILLSLMRYRKFLIIFDGFERLLVDYNKFNLMDQSYDDQETDDGRHCVDANAARFLLEISSLDRTFHTKILITSRMVIKDLEDRTGHLLDGCTKKELMPLSPVEAVSFMRIQGITKGLDTDILEVCDTYGFHPLTLRLLSGMIAEDKSNPGDISVAPKYDKQINIDLKSRRHHILEISYHSLPENLQTLISRIAAFRSSISYEALRSIDAELTSPEFDKAIERLIKRGLLLFDKEKVLYDMHPIVRRYAYENLKEKETIHKKLMIYYKLSSIPESFDSIEELMPIIELYYHTAKSGMYEEAARLYIKFSVPLQFQFCAFYSGIRLLKLLFPNEDRIPQLDNDGSRTYILNDYAMLHARLGQSQIAIGCYNDALKYAYKLNNKAQYYRISGNLVVMPQ
ncbi:MAG: metallophosphoesterase [Methanotrichaceae archaeon]|jgi:predicted phosphodiesterase